MTACNVLRRFMLATVLAVVLVVAGACNRSDEEVAGRLRVEGLAEVGAPGEDIAEVTASRAVRVGERVRLREGTAVLQLRSGHDLELRDGSEIEVGPAADDDGPVRPVLLAGDLLVVAPNGPLTVSAARTDVRVEGAARLSQGLSVVVESYTGAAELSSAGRTAAVPALRQVAAAAAGLFSVRPSPLDYSPDDPWDRRFLGDAFELGAELTARSRGFSAQMVRQEGLTVDLLRALLPRLGGEPAFATGALSADRPPGETLVGAAIVLEGTRGTFAERWAAVFAFRDAGADWGLVALDQGVARVPLLAAIDAAVDRVPLLFPVTTGAGGGRSPAAPDGLTPAFPLVPRSPASSTSTPPRPSGGTPAPSITTTVPPGSSASPPTTAVPPSVGPLNTGAPGLDSTVNALVETLSGLLRGLGGG